MKIEQEGDITKVTGKITLTMGETIDDFVLSYINPWINEVMHNKISKKEIIMAMRMYLNNRSVLETIKAEIKEEADFAYADFERYKVECLGQDWEDAYDSLPQDDFRYGMLRALEIICKHIGEKNNGISN